MAPKDYYAVLQLRPGASPPELKQAYRKLVKRFHPDRNPGDPYAEARFEAVREAYEVLADPVRREAYDRERGVRPGPGPLAPPALLSLARQLAERVAGMDWGRMDRKALHREILGLLSEERLRVLLTYEDSGAQQAILSSLLSAARPLNYPQTRSLEAAWLALAARDPVALASVRERVRRKRAEFRWKRWSAPLLLALAGLLCYLMYRWGNG